MYDLQRGDGREREGFGAVPSSQYRNLSGVVPKIESKKDGMEPDMKRAGLNSVKFLGVATIDEKDKRMKDKEKIETTNLIETEYPNVTNTRESSIEGGEAGTGAVLSSRQDVVGVFPEGICRKRKASEAAEDEKKKESEKPPVKYVGETSRSGYERIKEHYKDLENLSAQSHMLKHYIEKHKDIKIEEMKFRVKILKSYTSAFERQIAESVWIDNYLKQRVILINSKNEYNRCIIPRLGIDLNKDEMIQGNRERERSKERNSKDERENALQ